jgi:hypothetical protein
MTAETINVIFKTLESKAALVEHLSASGNPVLVGAAAEFPRNYWSFDSRNAKGK